MKTMKVPYQITGAMLLAVACFVGYESFKLRLYTPLGPGPGFFPLCLAALLAVLSLAMLIEASIGRPVPMPADFIASKESYTKMGAVGLAIVVVILVIEPLGFCLAMLAFYLFLLRVLGSQSWLLTIAIALAGSFGIFYAFTYWLANPLPVGLFGI